MLIKVAAVQSRMGIPLTLEDKLHIFKQKADFVCFPEYFLINEAQKDFSRAALSIKDNLDYLKTLSIELDTCLIGGSVAEGDGEALYNSTYVIDRGAIVGQYRKLSPVEGELRKGILPGDKLFITEIKKVRIAILICADALNGNLFEAIGQRKVDIVFIPTTSPYRPAERKSEKIKRDNEIYLAGAARSGSYIVKTCGVGSLFGKPLQGRSMIVAPWDFIKKIPDYMEQEPNVLTALLDIDEVREFRKKRHILI